MEINLQAELEKLADELQPTYLCQFCGKNQFQFIYRFHQVIRLCGKCFFKIPFNDVLRAYHKRQRATHTVS